jgi:multidrug resistance efflux pump
MKKNAISLLLFIILLVFMASCSMMQGGMPGLSEETAATEEPLADVVEAVDNDVSVEGRLVPPATILLSFPSAGQIETIFFKEGDQVKKGDIIARLAGTEQLESVIASADFELFSAQQARKALDDDLDLALNQVLQQLNTARQAAYDTERKLKILGGTAEKIDIDVARSQVVFAKNALDKAEDDFKPYANLAEDNLMRARLQVKLSEAQKAYDAAVRKYNNLTGTVSDFDQKQAETDYQIALGQLNIAQAKYDLLQNGPDPDDVASAEARITSAVARLKAAQADLRKLLLIATMDGKIVTSDLQEGLSVSPGQALIEVVDFTEWHVETENLTEIEVVDIQVGQQVTVVPDAIPDLELSGEVIQISDAFEDKRGEVTYTTRIKLNESDPRLRWGMTVIVDFGE